MAIGLGLLPYQIDELHARGGTPGLFIGSIAAVLSRPLTVNVAGGLGVSDSQNGQPGSEYAYVSLADEDCVVLAVSIDADHTAAITADPSLGFNVLAAGTNVQNATVASPAAMRVDGVERMYCTGYTFTAADGGTVTGSGSTIASLPALDGNATLVWHFSNREYTVTCSVLGDTAGTVVVGGGNGNWIAENATATLTATPSDAQVYEFQYWLGDVPYENRYDNPLALDVDAPKTLTAFFGKVAGATYRSADSDGDWYSATRWTPNGIPGMRDKAVLNSASTKRKIRLPDFFAVHELVVSNTCLLVAAADTSVNSTYTDYRGFVSYQPATSRDTARVQPIGFDVTGNLLIDKGGIVYAGGSGQLAYTKVNIDGDLAVTSGGLQLSAGVVITNVFPTSGASNDGNFVPYTDLQELFKGDNFLKVAGGTRVGPSGKIHTLNEYRCGAAVHLDLADVTVDEGGLFTGYVGGYNRFVLDNRVYTMCPGGLKIGDNKHGGSYGGRGGGQTVNSVSTIVPYGFTNAPFYPGSPHGAGSFRGGGTIRMDAKSLTLNGTLISSGYTGNKGASAGGGIWVNCAEFSIGENAVISVEGGSGVLTAGSGGGGGRAAICIGLSDDQMLQIFTNYTHAAEGVTVSSLAESIGARFTAAGGPGNASYSPGTDGSGVYIISTLGKKILNIYGEPANYGLVTPDYGPQTFDNDATVAFSAPEYVLVSDDNRSRRVCLGYSVTNAASEVLAQGTGHAGSFTIDSDCWLVWNWDLLEHEFVSCAVGGGILVTNAIPNTDSTWQPDQGAISITAVADSGYKFAGWYGDVTDGAQNNATLSLNLDCGRTVGALFVPVAAGAREWTGQGDGTTWIDPENWSPVGIPGSAEQIIITNGMVAANHCLAVEVGSLHVGTNATLTVATGSGFSTFTHLLSWAVPTDWLPCALKAAGDVVVDGTLVVGKKYSLSHADLIVSGNLSIGGQGKVYLHAGYNDDISYSSFTNWAVGGAGVRVGGRTELASGAWIYPWCEGLSGAPVVFKIGDLNIATNAGIRAVGAGWFWTTIEGVDFARWPTPQIGNVYTGGAYGGKSGDGVSHPATALPYGLATAPYMPGSSGGNGRITGGGSIRIHAGVIGNNGTLDASGANGWSSAGGGSGGGIWLTCMQYRTSLTSVTRADGGANNEGQAGGGGGRICIAIGLKDRQVGEFYETGAATGRYTVIDLTDEAIDASQYVKGVISAAGGISSAISPDCDGKPGTVVWIETPPPGTLIILR